MGKPRPCPRSGGWALRKVFEVELSSKNGCTELALPATRYALLDAVEKLELREGERPDWEILQTPACHNIYPYLDPAGGTLSELNALTQRLAQLNEREHAVVEGLAKLAHEQGERPIALSRLIDLAYSTDCCRVLAHCAPSPPCFARRLIRSVARPFQLEPASLGFELGWRRFRQNEGGAFVRGGYVQRSEELKQVYKTLDLTLTKPDYAILAELADGTQVKLPAPLGETLADDPAQCVDSAAPGLIGQTAMVSTLDMLARRLTELELDGELTKYKAVLAATGCEDIPQALALADELDRYRFDPEPREPDEVAAGHLKGLLPEEELAALLPNVSLYRYGQAVMEQGGGKLTGYGYVQPSIGPSQNMEQGQESDEMRMM